MTRFSKNTFAFCLLGTIGFFYLPAMASSNDQLNPYIPHTYLNGYIGDGGAGNFIGRADILAPLYTVSDKNLFLYGQGFYGDKETTDVYNVWALSAGAGYRQIIGSRIYGAYIFTDYSSTAEDNQFWTLSPGIESLGEIIDFRANGYFPLSTNKWTQETTPVFVSHETNYDLYQYYTDTESTGPGADAEIGVKAFSIDHMPLKLFLDGYAFYPTDNDNILGIGGRVTFQPTRYLTLEARYTYDNENHNVFMGGVRVYLNGFAYGISNNHVDDIGIQPRLYDQIERNFAAGNVGSAATTKDEKVPVPGPTPSNYYTVYVLNGSTGPVDESTDGVTLTGDGTLESPYIYTTEEDMQAILDATEAKYGTDKVVRVYYTSPNDQPFLMPEYVDDSSYIEVYTNQQIWGTTGYDWEIPATPDTYAVDFIGGFTLDSVNNVQFHYLSVDNYTPSAQVYDAGINYGTPFTYAIKITNSQNVTLQSAQIGNSYVAGYYVGVAMYDNSSIILNNAKIYGNKGDTMQNYGYGMAVQNGGNITAVNNSLVSGINIGIRLLPNTDDNNIVMGYINGDQTSSFIGGSYGLLAGSSPKDSEDLQADGASAISIDSISGVNFEGMEGGFVAYANSGDLAIGNIINSTFQGGVSGFSATSVYDVSIGDITDSAFQGSDVGFLANSFSKGGYGTVSIGNITDSQFTVQSHSTAANSSSPVATVTCGPGIPGGFTATSRSDDVTIGNVTNSDFSGGSDSPGFNVYIYNKYNGEIVIGTIRSSNFSGSSGVYLYGKYITIDDTSIRSVTDLYKYLSGITLNNNFKKVCLDYSCKSKR